MYTIPDIPQGLLSGAGFRAVSSAALSSFVAEIGEFLRDRLRMPGGGEKGSLSGVRTDVAGDEVQDPCGPLPLAYKM